MIRIKRRTVCPFDVTINRCSADQFKSEKSVQYIFPYQSLTDLLWHSEKFCSNFDGNSQNMQTCAHRQTQETSKQEVRIKGNEAEWQMETTSFWSLFTNSSFLFTYVSVSLIKNCGCSSLTYSEGDTLWPWWEPSWIVVTLHNWPRLMFQKSI